jgi:zinc/manganese transport system substrate-binding protein
MRGPLLTSALLVATLTLASCGSDDDDAAGTPDIVVTYSVLGAVVKDLVGDAATVTVLMPNGVDPHEWNPSAKDVERVQRADLVVENGLGLEEGLQDALTDARAKGVEVFAASNHVDVRTVGEGEGADPTDADQAPGAEDPHLWMDPLGMKDVVTALVPALAAVGVDVGGRGTSVPAGLDALHAELTEELATIPAGNRTLVTGHESLGYLARRYDFRLVGTVVPGVSSQAEPSAGEIADLVARVEAETAPAIFSEIGTPKSVVQAVADETGTEVVELSTHNLPKDGTYRTFLLDLASKISEALG